MREITSPKTEACPLNGQLFSKAERSIWEKRRPLGVTIENHLDSRPQSGLSKADVVYEVVAEGGITRFLVIYYCGAAAEDVMIGPVRSARTYFLDWVSEYGNWPLYTHVGGANLSGKANALGQIGEYGWVRKGNDLNQFSLAYPVFWRDYERLGRPVATEHTMYSTTDRLWDVAEERGLTQTDEEGQRWDENFTQWQFKEEAEEAERGQVEKVEFSFWESQTSYNVRWEYDRGQNIYRRFNGSELHKDLNNDQQLAAKTVIVQFNKETGPIDHLKHMLYQTIGRGEAIVFQDGQATRGTWRKEERVARTVFLDGSGQEMTLNPGQIWVEIVPAGNVVSY